MIPIAGVPRAVCVLASLVLLTLGVLATFKTDNGIGTGALIVVGGLAGVTAINQRVPRIRFGDVEVDSQVVRAHDAAVEETLANVAQALEEQKNPEEVIEEGRRASLGDPDDGWTTDERWLRHFKPRQPGSVYTIEGGPDGRNWGVSYDSITGHPKKVRRLPETTLKKLLLDEDRRYWGRTRRALAENSIVDTRED